MLTTIGHSSIRITCCLRTSKHHHQPREILTVENNMTYFCSFAAVRCTRKQENPVVGESCRCCWYRDGIGNDSETDRLPSGYLFVWHAFFSRRRTGVRPMRYYALRRLLSSARITRIKSSFARGGDRIGRIMFFFPLFFRSSSHTCVHWFSFYYKEITIRVDTRMTYTFISTIIINSNYCW